MKFCSLRKNTTAIISLALVFFFLLSTTTPILAYASAENEKTYNKKDGRWISHSPIEIYGNTDFTEENGVTDGNGTENNPYIIEGWNIYAGNTNGIRVKNTDVYFIIRKCTFHNSEYNSGICFENVTNTKVENVYSDNNVQGIYTVFIGNSEKREINYVIINSSFNSNQCGLLFSAGNFNPPPPTYNITISNCSIRYSYYNGVSIGENNVYNISIHHSNINNNGGYGIKTVQPAPIVNATYCWWGNTTGPGGVGPGTGDSITSGVTYIPWLPHEWADWIPPESHTNTIIPEWYNIINNNITVTVNVTEPPFHKHEIKNITLYYRYKTENSTDWNEWIEYGVVTNKPWIKEFNISEQSGDCYYEFYSIATDTNLNIEPSPLTADATCGIDITPPTTSDNIILSDWQNNNTVTLNAIDSFSEVNQTYYKLWENNTTPPLNWTSNSIINVTDDGVWNFKYYSTDNAGNQENIINKTIQIDTTAPNTTHNLNPVTPDGLNNYYVTPVTVQLTSLDMHSGVNNTFYRVNNGEWYTTTTQGFTISQDGNYQVEYYSTDQANNTENIKTLSFKIDVTPPQISITNITSDTQAKTIMVTWTTTSSDIESYMVKIDDTGWVNVGITDPYTNSYTFTDIISGEHTVYVKATDNAGHTSIKQQNVPDNINGVNENNGDGGVISDIFWIILTSILLTIIAAIIVAIIVKYKIRRKKRTKKEEGGEI